MNEIYNNTYNNSMHFEGAKTYDKVHTFEDPTTVNDYPQYYHRTQDFSVVDTTDTAETTNGETRVKSKVVLAAIRIADLALRVLPSGDPLKAADAYERDKHRLARIDEILADIDDALKP